MKPYILVFILLSYSYVFTQNNEEKIVIQSISENEYKFSSIDTILTPIAGAPEPFYSYWWEFGDGNYSTEDFPRHTYTNSGNMDILLARTNNYSNGKGRPKSKNQINVPENIMASTGEENTYLKAYEVLGINKNHSPKPDEEIIFVQTYKNNTGDRKSVV